MTERMNGYGGAFRAAAGLEHLSRRALAALGREYMLFGYLRTRRVCCGGWLREGNAVGTAAHCAAHPRSVPRWASGVVLHASAPREMQALLDAYAAVRPESDLRGRSPVPGRA